MRKKVSKILNKIKSLKEELKHIQNNVCTHDKIVYKYKSNKESYAPCDDWYLVDVKCLCCEKKFTFYSDADPYMYSNFKVGMGKVSCEVLE